MSVVSLTWVPTKDARIISRQFAEKCARSLPCFIAFLNGYPTLSRCASRLPTNAAYERGVFWLQLAVTANIVQRIDYEAL
jgi:hypothetical protein